MHASDMSFCDKYDPKFCFENETCLRNILTVTHKLHTCVSTCDRYVDFIWHSTSFPLVQGKKFGMMNDAIEIHHPCGESVFILGLCARSNGRSCEKHRCCGNAVGLDAVLRLRLVQVRIRCREESAIAAHWVTDGVDRCRVGFLGKENLQNAGKYNGKLVQITEFLSESDDPDDVLFSGENAGVCKAVIID